MQPILADAGIPMIAVEWPLMIGMLIPVIVVESLVIRHWIPLSYWQALVGAGRANLVSTFVGVPMAWSIMLAIQLGLGLLILPVAAAAYVGHWKLDSPVFEVVVRVISAAWEPPGLKEKVYWIIPSAAAVFLIPSFLVSVWLERRSCLKMWPTSDPTTVRRGVWFANAVSYCLLFITACVWMFHAVLTKNLGF